MSGDVRKDARPVRTDASANENEIDQKKKWIETNSRLVELLGARIDPDWLDFTPVLRWLEAGATSDLIVGIISLTAPDSLRSLTYFEEPIRRAISSSSVNTEVMARVRERAAQGVSHKPLAIASQGEPEDPDYQAASIIWEYNARFRRGPGSRPSAKPPQREDYPPFKPRPDDADALIAKATRLKGWLY